MGISDPENRTEMTASSISASVSKADLNEDMSMSFASMEDALLRISGGRRDDPISDERIRRGDELLLGTYQVVSDPIEGGMGSVYRVHHINWNMDLAMKRPKARFFAEAGDERKAAFIAECDYWIRLGLHPNIVSCYYVREIGGIPTIFSEWMDGGSLKDRIRDGSIYEGSGEEVQERILDVAIQAARGLRYSHESGLIHQDVKPGNILLTREWDAKVADFGIARASAQLEDGKTEAVRKAKTGGYTPQYCPAEQAAGDKPERWMDVYAFALTVLEMYAGRRLWETGADARNGTRSFCSSPDFRASVPETVRVLLDTCLTGRPDGFAEVETALEKAYLEVTGRRYPRAEAKAASDTADSLNNRALSFLDLGQPEESLRLWNQALYAAPGNIPVRFNRELYLLRSGAKEDYEAMDAIAESDACRKANAAADIFREWDRTRTPIPEPAAFEMAGCATGAVLSGEYIVFAFGNHIRRVRLDGQGGYISDELRALAPYRSRIVKIVLHPAGEEASVLLENGILCLYDILKMRVLRAVQTLPEGILEDILSSDYELRGSYSRDGRILALYSSKDNRGTILLDMPSMRVITGIRKDFCAFSHDNLPLVMGGTKDGAYALFEIDSAGQEKERFRFGSESEQYITKKIIPCARSPFLAFNMVEYGRDGRTEEDFFLDEEYHKTPRTTDPGQINFHDPENHLLYSVQTIENSGGKRHLMAIRDSRTLKILFSVEMGRKGQILIPREVLCDRERGRCVTWGTDSTKTLWSREAPYPSVTKNEPASYRLSEIVTAKERNLEDERLSGLLRDFRQAESAGNYAQALDIFCEARKIEGFHGSEMAAEMRDAADRFGEKYTLRTIRQIAESREKPAPFYSEKNWYRCRDGLIAVYESIRVPESGIRLYRPDGTLVQTLEMPKFASFFRVYKERIFAGIGGTFHAAVYDMKGNLLHAGPEGWPPPPDRMSDYRSPHLMDIDSTGRYILFGMQKLNQELTAPETGIFEIDTETGKMHKIADYVVQNDKYARYGYFDDDTILVRTGKTLSRFEKGTGRKLLSYRLKNPKDQVPYVSMNPDRDRFSVLVGSTLCAFDKDGHEIYYEKEPESTYDSICWFPGNRLICVHGGGGYKIQDLETGTLLYKAEKSSVFLSMAPDGRTIYAASGRGDNTWFYTYELEFDYKLKGTEDPGKAVPVNIVAEEKRDPAAGNHGSMDTAGTAVSSVTEVRMAPAPEKETDTADTTVIPVEQDGMVLSRQDLNISGEDRTVTVPDGIRKIGAECFMNQISLCRVILPDGVTEIGSRAFMNCSGLTSVSIPETVKRIGKEAFRGCTKLKEIRMPEALTELGACAFTDCESLKNATIPKGLSEIRYGLFSGCRSLLTVSLPDGLLEIGRSAFADCEKIRAIVIPDSVCVIHGDAFEGCVSLASVKLPAELRRIDDRLFRNKDALREIEIPEKVREIEEEAFHGCSKLTAVHFPASLRKIGKRAFGYCGALRELSIPAGCMEIGEDAFIGCVSVKAAVLPDTVKKIGKQAFRKCEQLEAVKFPEELEVIGEGAFSECPGLLKIETHGKLEKIGDSAFERCTGLTAATFAEGLIHIGHGAFKGCSLLSKVCLPETLSHIGIGAFSGCGLEGRIRIPAATETIREGAFSGCGRLEEIEVAKENGIYADCGGVLIEGDRLQACPAGKTGIYTVPEQVRAIGADGFDGCRGLTEIVLPETVLMIGPYAFRNCTGLTEIRIPASVTRLGSAGMEGDVFSGCNNLERITVEEGNPSFSSSDGILMSADGKELILFPPARGGEYTVPDRVERIGCAFEYGTAELTVTIRNGKVKAGMLSFRHDGSLRVDCRKGTPLYETVKKWNVPVVGDLNPEKEEKPVRSGWLKKIFGRK